MQRWINTLREQQSLPSEQLREIIESRDEKTLEYLRQQAHEVAEAKFGREIFVRGLIEITNYCKNDCFYCGVRCSNREVLRYRLSREQILEACRVGHKMGFRTFVLQGGEDPAMSDEWLIDVVGSIRTAYPDSAITLSLGERSRELYQRLYDAGANRYLLRHETHSTTHYEELHPQRMSLRNRLQCLAWLKEIGYQTGTGIMVGTPKQRSEHIVEDLEYIRDLDPEMVGVGPFLPHHATPFADAPAGSMEMTLKLISIIRLMLPSALIPATTALATIAKDGRRRGILAGANVVMPNLSPVESREYYSLYDNKASLGAESAEGLRMLQSELDEIDYSICYGRGDYPTTNTIV